MVAAQMRAGEMLKILKHSRRRIPYLGSATNWHQLCRGLARHPGPALNEDSCRNFLLTVSRKKSHE